MKVTGEFPPLVTLFHSLGSNRRLYFIYRNASNTGSAAARLRFQWFKQRLPKPELEEFELLFEGGGTKRHVV